MASYVLGGYTTPEGVSSRNQVKAIQSQLGVKSDGIWGPKTQAAYDAYTSRQSAQSEMLNMLRGAAGGGFSTSGYTSAINDYNRASEAAFGGIKADNLAQAQKLKDQYNSIRSQAYVNRRLGAIGNNELLAAMGLAGNMYSDPGSGATESSRISQNIGMRNDVNAVSIAEQNERDTLAQQLLQAKYDSEMQAANMAAQVNMQMANAQASASSQYFQNLLALAQFEQGLNQNALNPNLYYSGGRSSGSGGFGNALLDAIGNTPPPVNYTDRYVPSYAYKAPSNKTPTAKSGNTPPPVNHNARYVPSYSYRK